MRIALLSYRSKPHCGGQGIYIRDLYREPDPFRLPKLKEFRDRIDVEEFATMCAAGFPEPKTFSLRAVRELSGRVDEFDVVHDNQVLGYGMLEIEKLGLPLLTTLHHPISYDRRIDIASTRNPWRKLTLSRWYGFVKMQARVARQARKILTPSETSKRDIAKDFGVDPERMQVILLGVDDLFVPPTKPRVPGRIMAMASAEKLIDKLSIQDSVHFVHGISDAELVELMGSAELACVPSLYEGFSLPTAELMACGTPLVASDAGAIPEVVGPDGLCADLVTPGDVGELEQAIAAMLDDPERRQ